MTVLQAPLVDGDYNAQTRDWAHATETVVPRCTIDFTGTSESKAASDQTVTRAQLCMPARAPQITEWHRVQWAGRTWEVDGVPNPAEATGPLAGQIVNLLEVAG